MHLYSPWQVQNFNIKYFIFCRFSRVQSDSKDVSHIFWPASDVVSLVFLYEFSKIGKRGMLRSKLHMRPPSAAAHVCGAGV